MKVTGSNYFGTVIKVEKTIALENCDNVVGLPIFGYQAIVSKETKIGDTLVVFPPECRLDDEFLRVNNMYRKSEMNSDPTKKWYIESNGRVRAIKFRNQTSNALAVPLSYLDYTGAKLEVWDEFTELNGKKICEKFELPKREQRNKQGGQQKKYERVDVRFFPEHIDTEQYLRRQEFFKDSDRVIVTQKLHWTSGRFGNVRVTNKPTWKDKVANYFGYHKEEYDYIAGSRKVIKDTKSDKEFEHFYEDDIWNQALERIKTSIPKDTIIFAEIIGWIGDSPIQKGYTYNIPKWEYEIYVYRIAQINRDGIMVDYSWEQIKEFCNKNEIKYCPELFVGLHSEFDYNIFVDKKYQDFLPGVVTLSQESPCDEWICIRREHIVPYLTKVKSPMFYEFETKQLDSWEADTESLN